MIRSQEFVNQLYSEYLSGKTITELDKKYRTDCYYHFKRNNLRTRTPKETVEIFRNKAYRLNYNFLDISTKEQAYIIGIIMADGYVSNSQIGLRLKKSDIKIVNTIKSFFSEEIKLQEDELSVSFTVSSIIACKNIEKLGIYPKKTNKELSIPIMRKNLIKHFIRGYFDGDGSVFITKQGLIRMNICSPTINILKEIQEYFNTLNIISTITKENRKGKIQKVPTGYSKCNKDMYRLYINNKKGIEIFYKHIYKDCGDFFLERKKKVFSDNKERFKYKRLKITSR